jgi:hypothetical protein
MLRAKTCNSVVYFWAQAKLSPESLCIPYDHGVSRQTPNEASPFSMHIYCYRDSTALCKQSQSLLYRLASL